jgi:hypothetical protein
MLTEPSAKQQSPENDCEQEESWQARQALLTKRQEAARKQKRSSTLLLP